MGSWQWAMVGMVVTRLFGCFFNGFARFMVGLWLRIC